MLKKRLEELRKEAYKKDNGYTFEGIEEAALKNDVLPRELLMHISCNNYFIKSR